MWQYDLENIWEILNEGGWRRNLVCDRDSKPEKGECAMCQFYLILSDNLSMLRVTHK